MRYKPFDAVTQALTKIGLVAWQKNDDQLVVSAQPGAVFPDQGNSFWLSHQQGDWYLCTWSSVCYRVPATQDVVDLCAACMKVGTSALYRVPPEFVQKFGLEELDEEEFDRLFPSRPRQRN